MINVDFNRPCAELFAVLTITLSAGVLVKLSVGAEDAAFAFNGNNSD
ncbi:hypothetical protein NDK25_07565 [Niallia taxi]|nr:hypothetical protein [Niallia taxi]MDE5052265.1 hypothetical protein [Niallia taxi]